MEETAKNEVTKKPANGPKKESKISIWWKEIKSEFKKIVWPDKPTLFRESVAVVIISVILGAIIALLDAAIKLGLDKIIVS